MGDDRLAPMSGCQEQLVRLPGAKIGGGAAYGFAGMVLQNSENCLLRGRFLSRRIGCNR
jgi:hypothetical protein